MKLIPHASICLVMMTALACGCSNNETDAKNDSAGFEAVPQPQGGGKQPGPEGKNKPTPNGQSKPVPTGIQGTWVVKSEELSQSSNAEFVYTFSGDTITAAVGVKGGTRRKTRSQGTFRLDETKGEIHTKVRYFSGRENRPGPVIEDTMPYKIEGNTLILGEGQEAMTLKRLQ